MLNKEFWGDDNYLRPIRPAGEAVVSKSDNSVSDEKIIPTLVDTLRENCIRRKSVQKIKRKKKSHLIQLKWMLWFFL